MMKVLFGGIWPDGRFYEKVEESEKLFTAIISTKKLASMEDAEIFISLNNDFKFAIHGSIKPDGTMSGKLYEQGKPWDGMSPLKAQRTDLTNAILLGKDGDDLENIKRLRKAWVKVKNELGDVEILGHFK